MLLLKMLVVGDERQGKGLACSGGGGKSQLTEVSIQQD